MSESDSLDHIIYLAPHGQLDVTVNKLLSLGFHVLPGGQHADGLTSNALIVLSGGVYIEVIAFDHTVDHCPEGSPERDKREKHWWSNKVPGWIDWALSGRWGGGHSEAHESRADDKSVDYQSPVEGGRAKPNGDQLRWKVTFPALKHGRGCIPFFCEDLTPRDMRVPVQPQEITAHPSGALGISHFNILVEEDRFESLRQQLECVLGSPADSGSPDSQKQEASWSIQAPRFAPSRSYPQLVLTVPVNEDQAEFVRTRGPGIWEVGFSKDSGNLGQEGFSLILRTI